MWLVTLAFPIIVVMVVGGLIAGGIYTIVFIPVAVIIGGFALVYTIWGRSTKQSNIPGERERVRPLPHTQHSNTAASPATPDQLVDAQRQQQ
jgi:hypothetical protein